MRQDPGVFAWMLASLSLALPWLGIGLCLAGLIRLADGNLAGGWLLSAGLAAFLLDVDIDFVWAHPAVSASDPPALNQRGAQLIGRAMAAADRIGSRRGRGSAGG